jgi:hypothetical protein
MSMRLWLFYDKLPRPYDEDVSQDWHTPACTLASIHRSAE